MSSPSSPLLPSVEELPRWVKQSARRVSVLSNGRFRIIFIAAACILMGYFLTSSFSEPDQSGLGSSPRYDSSEILEGPTEYKTGYDSADELPATTDYTNGHGHQLKPGQHSTSGKTPSIKGALTDLHHAVSGKLSSLKTSLTPASLAHNITHSGIFSAYSTYNSSSSASALTLDILNVTEEIIAPGRDLLGARQRIGKVTIIFGGAAIYERAVRTHEAHDRLHGYPLHVLRHGMLDDVWSKPAYVLALLLREMSRPESERLQWLLWVDADTILLNPHVPVETFLPPSPEFDDVHLLVTRDWNGLNNGVFPVRVNQWAVDLFAAIVSFRHYKPDVPLVFRDQSAMDELLKERAFARHTAWAPQRWFNAYQGEHNETLAPYQVRRGDFLVHFAGVGDRNERMGYWLDRVEQHLPDWEIEVQHTSYPSEAREFWRQQRQMRSDNARLLVEARVKANELMQKTEEQLAEYQMRLQEGEIQIVREKMKKLREVVDGQDVEVARIDEGVDALTTARSPLESITTDANKALLKEAHEAIFSAEKVLLTQSDRSGNDVQKLEEKTGQLKKLVLQPTWLKVELSQAIDEVRKVRAGLEQQTPTAPLDPEQAARLAAIDKQNHGAEVAKAEILGHTAGSGLEVAGPTAAANAVDGFVVTHTATAVEMTTHLIVVMETATVDPNPNR